MESGLAKQIKYRYPYVYEEYKNYCMITPPQELLGKAQIVMVDKYTYVVNLFGQFDYGKGTCHTNYIALENAMKDMFDYAERYNFSIVIPWGIGCGLAGGSWDKVYKIICNISEHYTSVKVVLFKLEE